MHLHKNRLVNSKHNTLLFSIIIHIMSIMKDIPNSTQKDTLPQFIITPVATLAQNMKLVKQRTLAQMLGIADGDTSDEDTDGADFVVSKKPKKETVQNGRYNTPVRK